MAFGEITKKINKTLITRDRLIEKLRFAHNASRSANVPHKIQFLPSQTDENKAKRLALETSISQRIENYSNFLELIFFTVARQISTLVVM